MSKKQAVLLIHGVGEQRPMDSLREFVDAVWTTDTTLHREHGRDAATVWSKPDKVSDSFELRRLTTGKNKAGIRTDFFEFYWAHMVEGTTFDHLSAWFRSVLWRRPSRVPPHLKAEYCVSLVAVVIAFAFIVYLVWARNANADAASPISLVSATIVVLGPMLVGFIHKFVFRDVVGDAARYLDRSPKNIDIRTKIRQAGVQLLRELHHRDYYRIIVVGHSLGSVIGYDILTHSWIEFNEQLPPLSADYEQKTDALAALEHTMGKINDLDPKEDVDYDAVQTLQRLYIDELHANKQHWSVTDFITLGSPLAHAEVLLARDADDLDNKKNNRELPTSPPVFEARLPGDQDEQHFSFMKRYEKGEEEKKVWLRIPHHAAVFGPTRWTNIYFPKKGLIVGDVIGGKISPVFGKTIRDIEARTKKRFGLLSHTLYWTPDSPQSPGEHIKHLRNAIDLLDTRAT